MSQPGPAYPLFLPQGDSALLAYLGQGIDLELNTRLHAWARALKSDPVPGLLSVLAAYCCLQIHFDPLASGHAGMEQWARQVLARLGQNRPRPGRQLEIPVVYGGRHGPDLEFVAGRAGVSAQEVIARHSGRAHPCFLVGFTPGFPFLGGLDPLLASPRLDSPRAELPAGAVGIGGDQTGLYPLGGPGGWRILGRTPLLVYDPRRAPACLIEAGDLVRFLAIPESDMPEAPQAGLSWQASGQEVMEVLSPGSLTTIQDQGRLAGLEMGVPVSGALDQFSLAVANALVGNPPGAAALELTLMGPKLKVLRPITAAICGADLGARLNGQPAPTWTPLKLRPGDLLEFRGPKNGARAVLALAGGLASEPLLGSRSVYVLGRLGAPLQAGALLGVLAPAAPPARRAVPEELRPLPCRRLCLRALPGPNADHFGPAGLETLLANPYVLTSQADRRGARLRGAPVPLMPGKPTSIVSEPNIPGIVQAPPDGQPMILLREQTIGGYAKVATVIGPDLDLLARALPGDELRFEAVSQAQAQAACRERAAWLARICQAVAG